MKKCICGSTNIKHEEKSGRGLPPKSYNPPKLMPKKYISWKVTWDIWTCEDCGEVSKKIRR